MMKKMTIAEILKGVDDSSKCRAEQYLDSKKVHSVKQFFDGLDSEFEAFIEENPKMVLMPYFAIGDGDKVMDIHCQCGNPRGLCIHEIALLIAAQFMIEADSPDYHMAQKILIAKKLGNLLFK